MRFTEHLSISFFKIRKIKKTRFLSFVLFFTLFTFSFSKVGNYNFVNDQVINEELNTKLQLESYVDASKFKNSNNIRLYGFNNLEKVNMLVIKINDTEKEKAIIFMGKFFLTHFPGKTSMNFRRGNLFTMVLYEKEKVNEAKEILNVMDHLFSETTKNAKVTFYKIENEAQTKI